MHLAQLAWLMIAASGGEGVSYRWWSATENPVNESNVGSILLGNRPQGVGNIPSFKITAQRFRSMGTISCLPARIPIAKLCLGTLLFVIVLIVHGSLAALAQEKAAITVTAVGDVRITRGFARNKLEEIRRIKLQGDIVFGNFEGVLTNDDSPDPWKFSVPLESVALLKSMGFNTLSLANNHSLDLGENNYRKTLSLLGERRFWVVGREGHGVVAEINNLRVRTIGFSFSGGNSVNNLDTIPAIIGKKQNEIIIVSAHMGGENHLAHRIPNTMEYFGDEKRGDVIPFSHRCIDAGADLVLGHSPHVPRGLELYKNKLIVYSQGNFLFDYPGAGRNAHAPGYSLSINLDEKGDFQSARIESYDLQYGFPVLDTSGRAYNMIQNLTFENLKQTSLAFPGNGVVRKGN